MVSVLAHQVAVGDTDVKHRRSMNSIWKKLKSEKGYAPSEALKMSILSVGFYAI
jgi:hypothetical protein